MNFEEGKLEIYVFYTLQSVHQLKIFVFYTWQSGSQLKMYVFYTLQNVNQLKALIKQQLKKEIYGNRKIKLGFR